jgi:hypothetical protein
MSLSVVTKATVQVGGLIPAALQDAAGVSHVTVNAELPPGSAPGGTATAVQSSFITIEGLIAVPNPSGDQYDLCESPTQASTQTATCGTCTEDGESGSPAPT